MRYEYVRCEARNLVKGDIVQSYQDYNDPMVLAAVVQIEDNENGTYTIIFMFNNRFRTEVWDGLTPFAKFVLEAPVMYTTNYDEIMAMLSS